VTGSITTTFVAMTYNLWGDAHLTEREPALRALFRTRPPDLLATQELRPGSRALIDAELPGHARVVDNHPGWARQSNLWWRRELFELVAYGVRDVGILDPAAGLFWVRLRTSDGVVLVFATAHLTWPGHAEERTTGVNQRVPQARAIVAALDELAGDGPCLFTADVNDIGGPLWELGNAGFLDSFTALGSPSPPTHPVVPMPFTSGRGTRLSPVQSPAKAIDWLFHRGALRARTSEVVEFFHDGSAPSDHKPVVATFTLAEGANP
jgi:endonuclease/exonuclease/phosphatase family metal-dependent hydrolase